MEPSHPKIRLYQRINTGHLHSSGLGAHQASLAPAPETQGFVREARSEHESLIRLAFSRLDMPWPRIVEPNSSQSLVALG
jgi:hypothetical protein